MPYRDAPLAAAPLAPSEGIVDDMVRQFADPYAFLRELVQNGIDAGATRIEVRIERGMAGTIRTTVADDGTGMSRATIEGPLLTLFESSKENDDTKIGKYGVGFVSVFAINPTLVEVATWRSGESWLLRLSADHSYELAVAPPREGHGTEVTLVNELADDGKLALHEQRAATALAGWCRHARVEIVLSTDGLAARTINAPLTVPGTVVVSGAEGPTRFAIGIGDVADAGGESSAQFAGFYNHGLTLLETTSGDHVRRGIRFKIDSPKLAHTLSRDDVRRDESYHDAFSVLKRMMEGPLVDRFIQTLRDAASEAVSNPPDRYLSILQFAASPVFERARPHIEVPLVDRHGNGNVALLSSLDDNRRFTGTGGILFADASSPLTQALTAVGRPVLLHSRIAAAIGRFARTAVVPADAAAGLVNALPEAEPLADEIARLCAIVGRRVGAVRLATFHGFHASTAFRLVERANDRTLLPAEDRKKPSWSTASTLFLNANHELVRLARRRAKTDLRIAAHLVFRALLLDDGAISERNVDLLLLAARRT